MDYLKYAIRKKYIASAKSYLVLKVLNFLWDTDVVFRVKLILTYFAFLDYLEKHNKIYGTSLYVESLLPLIDFCRNTLRFSERVFSNRCERCSTCAMV